MSQDSKIPAHLTRAELQGLYSLLNTHGTEPEHKSALDYIGAVLGEGFAASDKARERVSQDRGTTPTLAHPARGARVYFAQVPREFRHVDPSQRYGIIDITRDGIVEVTMPAWFNLDGVAPYTHIKTLYFNLEGSAWDRMFGEFARETWGVIPR